MTTEMRNNRSRKGITTGIIILGIGLVWLLRRMGIFFPDWLVQWYMIPVAIGVAIGLGSKFKNPASWILIAVGGFFFVEDVFNLSINLRRYFGPIVVIAIGLIVLLRPRKKKSYHINTDPDKGGAFSEERERGYDYKGFTADNSHKIDSVSIFNGLKKRVQSKQFRGGESVTVFGGTEINLLDADFEGTINLEVVVVFGGMKLIVPPNWEVRNDVSGILGGVEDKRSSAVQVVPDDKILVLTGIVIFGGLDIVNY